MYTKSDLMIQYSRYVYIFSSYMCIYTYVQKPSVLLIINNVCSKTDFRHFCQRDTDRHMFYILGNYAYKTGKNLKFAITNAF